MLFYSISFLLGICIIQQLHALPEPFIFLSLPIIVLLAARYRSVKPLLVLRYISVALAGAFWATLVAQDYLDFRLPESLAGKNIIIEGRILDIPTLKRNSQRFVVAVDSFTVENSSSQLPSEIIANLPKRIRISWYYSKVEVKSGDTWRFLVRLKPPHGFLNPGGFDYEAWLYQQGIHATGYVRKSEINQKLESSHAFSIDAIRQSLSHKIKTHLNDSNHHGLIAALAVGNRSSIQSQQWDDLIKTGTNHLMSISGLHIGLAAVFGYWLTRRIFPVVAMKKISAQQVSVSVGVLFALCYAFLAGFAIPAQRALIMLVCIAVAMLLKRNFNPVNVLSIALFLVLLNDPVSVLSVGFWFSFLAVAVIFYMFRQSPGSAEIETDSTSGINLKIVNSIKKKLWQWGSLQMVITLALFPLSLLIFQQTSLIAPLANFVLVPFISFLVVPLVLLAIITFAIYEPLAILLLQLANGLIESIWPFVHYLAQLPLSHWVHNVSGLGVTILAMLGIAIMFTHFSKRIRLSGALLILPLLVNSSEKLQTGSFEMQLLDVGQGLAVIVKTQNHILVYDAGARFSDKFDSGKAVVLPALRKSGTDKLDMLIISHGDNDHIGGAANILAAYPSTQLVGQDIQSLTFDNKRACHNAMQWDWDGVHFQFLHPDGLVYKKRNNRSCVLKVKGLGGTLLLTGDIEKKIEKKILKSGVNLSDIDVLVVPHHGSKTSSSMKWLNAINPKIALFSVGYRNRYRLPSNVIVQRYHQLLSEQQNTLLSTASSGAIRIRFDVDDGVTIIDQYRIHQSRYWNHQLPQL